MNKLPLSALIAGIITLSGSSYASDDLSFSNVEKTPSPAGPVPIPYPIIITTPEKPDQVLERKYFKSCLLQHFTLNTIFC